MKTATKIVIDRAPIMYDDIRESEAEVRFLISEDSPRLLAFHSFLLSSIDFFSFWVAYLQTHVHNVPIIVIFNELSSDIDIADGDVVVSIVIFVRCVCNLACVGVVDCVFISLFPVGCIIFFCSAGKLLCIGRLCINGTL